MITNRIGGLFSGGNNSNKFEHVLFEKFDPKITRQVSKEVFGEDESDEDEDSSDFLDGSQKEFVGQKLTVHQESQLLDFNLWIMHLNVDITPRMISAIEEIDGVETLDIISRYRARLGIAKLFPEEAIKKNVSETINKIAGLKAK
jgi:DNA polymerase III delta prime subunit